MDYMNSLLVNSSKHYTTLNFILRICHNKFKHSIYEYQYSLFLWLMSLLSRQPRTKSIVFQSTSVKTLHIIFFQSNMQHELSLKPRPNGTKLSRQKNGIRWTLKAQNFRPLLSITLLSHACAYLVVGHKFNKNFNSQIK